jgi:hypothetical protein
MTGMPTRRIFLMTVVVVVLAKPATACVRAWGKRQLIAREPGSVLHGAGEVLVTVL